MEHLVSPNPDKFKGCELIFPDTAFFSGGKPVHIIKNDKDFCLMSIKNPMKLQLLNLYKDFFNAVRDRRNDNNGVFSQIYHKNFQLQAINRLQTISDVGEMGSPERLKSLDASLLSGTLKQPKSALKGTGSKNKKNDSNLGQRDPSVQGRQSEDR